MKFRPFPIPVVLLLALLHVYVGVRLLAPFGAVAQLAGMAVVAVCFWLFPKGFWIRDDRGPWAVLLPWLVAGFFSWLLVLTVARDVSLLGSALALTPQAYDSWSRVSALGVMALTPAITLIGFFMARRAAPVNNVDVPLAGLPKELEGFTIAQISDIHVGATIKRNFVDAIVDRVNGLHADMVAITGDVVDGSVPDLAHHTEPLARLASRHGTYFVTGNHEYYSGAHEWIREFRRLGARVLMNEHVVLDHDGAALAVAGVADWSAHHFDPSHKSDPHAAARGAPERAPKVLLAHQPRSAALAEAAGFHLQLSGHTHGGQFWPWNFLVRLQQPFTAGLNRLGRMWVYTSRGTGYWGPPMRFGVPSEITLIRLTGNSGAGVHNNEISPL
ncbi:MAG TPA: metallophosphoesterase [Burkholderiales bacterium]|nr:metallophosphoesterase [Burkholderiales bacterium]